MRMNGRGETLATGWQLSSSGNTKKKTVISPKKSSLHPFLLKPTKGPNETGTQMLQFSAAKEVSGI